VLTLFQYCMTCITESLGDKRNTTEADSTRSCVPISSFCEISILPLFNRFILFFRIGSFLWLKICS